MKTGRWTIGLLVAGALGVWAWELLSPTQVPGTGGMSVTDVLAGVDTAGFERAVNPRPFVFPRDHGPHEDFRTEWWYVTANLSTESGERFGVQLTLFRSALSPDEPDTLSAWSTRQAYMGHFAVTDVDGSRFRSFERFARGAQGLAGATPEPFRVWVEDWELAADAGSTFADPGSAFAARMIAEEESVRVDLRLRASKPRTDQGDRGLSRKGPTVGNASYYYSFTRLDVSGEVGIEGAVSDVTGSAWMDREWSTSALSAGQVGWDWFALQLDDGTDVMFYRMRRADGSADPFSRGVVVGPDGARSDLAAGDVEVEVLDEWSSPRTGVSYPSGWRLRVRGARMDLTVEPVLSNQELDHSFRYWEGAVDVSGTYGDGDVRGVGYVELTGYGESSTGGRTDPG